MVGWGVTTKLFPKNGTNLFIYAHLSTPVTGWITRASVAGQVGRTGNITCEKTHLHFEAMDARSGKRIDRASVSNAFQWLIGP